MWVLGSVFVVSGFCVVLFRLSGCWFSCRVLFRVCVCCAVVCNSANEGAGALASGLSEYAQKMGEYQTGVATLNSKVPQLIDGLNQLNEGVEKLNDGMKQFVEEGINKIAELASADVEAELDKVKAVITAASEYTAIDGDNENSVVKFIIKTN